MTINDARRKSSRRPEVQAPNFLFLAMAWLVASTLCTNVFPQGVDSWSYSDAQAAAIKCDNGDLPSCNAIGVWLERSGKPEAAAEILGIACNGGVPVACSNLAELYFDGRGVGRDLGRAGELFSGACEASVSSGCAGFCVLLLEYSEPTNEQRGQCHALIANECSEGNPWMCQFSGGSAGTTSGPCTTTAAQHLANAYVKSQCIFALFLGDVRSYVASNSQHFVSSSNVIRCARSLSTAMTQQAISSYDPNWMNSQAQLNAQLGAMGISPGPAQSSPSAQFYAMARQIQWLSEVLPAAAAGNYGPLNTPVTEEQQLQAFACQMMLSLAQDPTMASSLSYAEPSIREAANITYRMIVDMAMSINP